MNSFQNTVVLLYFQVFACLESALSNSPYVNVLTFSLRAFASNRTGMDLPHDDRRCQAQE